MAEHVVADDTVLAGGFGWEPNAPDAVLVCDGFAHAALAQRAHPDDPDQRCAVLRWDVAIHAQLAPPNDEGRHEHRLDDVGLRGVLWIGVVQESRLVAQLAPFWPRVGDRRAVPTHYIVVSKECVVEVVAWHVEVLRIDGRPLLAAASSIDASDQ